MTRRSLSTAYRIRSEVRGEMTNTNTNTNTNDLVTSNDVKDDTVADDSVTSETE